jgi:hypothetical protein
MRLFARAARASVLLFVAVFVSFSGSRAEASAPQTPTTDSKERARLEELFIWKTSEELKLQPAAEQKFTDVIHALNKRRRNANARMDAALDTLALAKTKTEIEKALAAHRAALRETQAVQTSRRIRFSRS